MKPPNEILTFLVKYYQKVNRLLYILAVCGGFKKEFVKSV